MAEHGTAAPRPATQRLLDRRARMATRSVAPVVGDAPLSFGQERLWIMSQIQGGTGGGGLVNVFRLRGRLDRTLLDRALTELHRRHDILRTVIGRQGGTAVQRVIPPAPVTVPVVDVSGETDPMAAAHRATLDLDARPYRLDWSRASGGCCATSARTTTSSPSSRTTSSSTVGRSTSCAPTCRPCWPTPAAPGRRRRPLPATGTPSTPPGNGPDSPARSSTATARSGGASSPEHRPPSPCRSTANRTPNPTSAAGSCATRSRPTWPGPWRTWRRPAASRGSWDSSPRSP